MENDHNKTADKRMEDPAGALAVTLLAYGDMDNLTEIDLILRETDRATLGRAIILWYQMCTSTRGSESAAKAARIVAQKLQNQLDNLDRTDHAEYVKQGLPLSFSRSLMLHLCQGEHERFTEMWALSVAPQEDLTVAVASVFLGFTRSVLNPATPNPACG